MNPAWRRAALLGLLPGMLLAGAARGGGDDVPDGAALHTAQCTGCHAAAMYTRTNRIVKSLEELRARGRQCELMAGAAWFDEEVEAVVDYLDATYYRFGN